MSAIIGWFFFVTKQKKSLVLICLRSSFCSSREEEGGSDMLPNVLLPVWVFMTQNVFWIVIFNIWLIFHSVWVEKPRRAGLGAKGARYSLTCSHPAQRLSSKTPRVGCQPRRLAGWQPLSLKLGDQIFLHRSPWQVGFKATFRHPNAHREQPVHTRCPCAGRCWGEDGTSGPSWTFCTLLPSCSTHFSPLPTTTCLLLPCSPLPSRW